MASLKPCKTCTKEVASSAKICPHCGQKLKSGFFVKVIKGIVLVVFLLILIGLLLPDPDQVDGDSSSPVPSKSSTIEAQEVQIADPRPAAQTAFLKVLEDGRSASSSAANDMQKGAALADREKLICSILPRGKRVSDWHGTIYSINANSDGKGVLIVELDDSTWVSTWNNALSDIGTNTLIEPNTGLFKSVSALSPGDRVIFSGEFFTEREGCIRTQNLMLSSKINRPEFVFKFSKVRLAE